MFKAPVSSHRFNRRQIYAAITAIVLVLVIGVGGWLLLSRLSERAGEGARLQQEANAQNIAARVSVRLTAYREPLAELAALPETRALFAAANPAALAAAGDRQQRRFAGALKLRYILPGNYQLDNTSFPPLSYASLDMLRQAETSGDTRTEVHLHGTPDAHVVMLQRVNNGAFKPAGFLHLSLGTQILNDLLGDIELDQGYAELVQPVAGRNIVLATAGKAAARQDNAAMADVPGAHLQIAYWPRKGVILSFIEGSGHWLPYAPLALALILLTGGLLIMKRKEAEAKAAEDTLSERLAAAEAETEAGTAEEELDLFLDDDKDAITVVEIPPKETGPKLDPVIFRAYDIRGIVGKTLTKDAVHAIAGAIGTRAEALGQPRLVVGRDGRNSSPELAEALIEGLCASGRDVIDIGLVPTPLLYFATHQLGTGSGVMLTGSHNGPEYNGLKIMLDGHTLGGEDIKEIQRLAGSDELIEGEGELQRADIAADYMRRVSEDIQAALGNALKVVIDCGNGAAGVVAPRLINMLGHDVIELHCEIDGSFPNHHPDPSQPENLRALIDRVKAEGADIGLAFDGDGDRLGVVDAEGHIIWPDRQLMLLAKDVLSRNPGAPIIFDVKCSRHLQSLIEAQGGQALMWKTGHSFIKSKMQEVDAPLAGEMSGHIFFKERWYGFDDALYTAARLIEVFTHAGRKPAEMFRELPEDRATPELRLPLPEQEHGDFMQQLEEKLTLRLALYHRAEVIKIDGLRIEYQDGWGLVRPSNTSPNIILRFEGKNEAVLQRIQAEFAEAIHAIKPDTALPF